MRSLSNTNFALKQKFRVIMVYSVWFHSATKNFSCSSTLRTHVKLGNNLLCPTKSLMCIVLWLLWFLLCGQTSSMQRAWRHSWKTQAHMPSHSEFLWIATAWASGSLPPLVIQGTLDQKYELQIPGKKAPVHC